jgi:N-acetylglucosaminyldiphosphoundecaprenol N-acetyl-beta-D-mannosaminyltransferase
MIDRGKKNILGILVDAVDYEAAITKIMTAANANTGMTVSALAVHGVMTGIFDPTQRYRLNHLDLVVPDGQPVRWALNWLYHTHLSDRVYGPTLMLKICECAAQQMLPIYLYGSRPSVIETLSHNLRSHFPDLIIAGVQPSRFRQISTAEKEEVVQEIHQSGAAITFVGLGCPRQEIWIYEYYKDLPMPLIAVGAAFDFHAGMLPQAPPLLQRSGLEWFYRLIHEPRRLWKRYMFLNPLYLSLLMLQFSGIIHFDPTKAKAPVHEIHHG